MFDLDDSVWQEIRAGLGINDRVQQERFVTRFEAALLGTAVWCLNDRHLAEDVVQETLLGFMRYRDRLPEHWTDARNLLFAIRRNKIADIVRRRRVKTIEFTEAAAPRAADGDFAEAYEAYLHAFDTKLNQEQRETLYLEIQEGFEPDEIARIMDTEPGTVASRKSRALVEIRTELGIRPCGTAGPPR